MKQQINRIIKILFNKLSITASGNTTRGVPVSFNYFYFSSKNYLNLQSETSYNELKNILKVIIQTI